MRLILLFCGLIFAVVAPTFAEEITLKDGTKILGRMTAIKGDKIEVQTQYGKMQIRRLDIMSIEFPENSGRTSSESGSEKPKPQAVDESLDGTEYVNRTSHFTLHVPLEWKINSDVRGSFLAGLSSRDEMRFVIIEKESFAGSLESYKGLVEVQAHRNLEGYEKLSEADVKVDGLPAALITFRGVNTHAQNLPIEFISMLMVIDGEAVHAVGWCAEPLFNESQRTLENILLSYKRFPGPGVDSVTAPTASLQTESTTRVSASSDAQETRMIERVAPVYPPLARQTRVQGTVRLHVIIGIDGKVKQLEVVSGHPLLIQSAMDAVKQWRYSPTTLNGQPVEVDTIVDVIYSLADGDNQPAKSSSPSATQPASA